MTLGRNKAEEVKKKYARSSNDQIRQNVLGLKNSFMCFAIFEEIDFTPSMLFRC